MLAKVFSLWSDKRLETRRITSDIKNAVVLLSLEKGAQRIVYHLLTLQARFEVRTQSYPGVLVSYVLIILDTFGELHSLPPP